MPDPAGRLRLSWARADGFLLGRLRDALRRELARLLDRPGRQVIDIGAGSQPYRGLVRHFNAAYTACDLGEGSHIAMVAGKDLPLDAASFDVGLSIQVLEHVWDLEDYLRHFRKHLKPDGTLILSTHGVWLYHPHPTDYRRWTRVGLMRELEAHGFKVERCMAIMGPLAWATQVRAIAFQHVCQKFGALGSLVGMLVLPLFNLRMALEDRITPAAIVQDNACVYVVLCKVAQPAAG
jgi:SAM-dependent methyltransferase